jgi:hypothetical protein
MLGRWRVRRDGFARFAFAPAWLGERGAGGATPRTESVLIGRRLCERTSQLDGDGDQFGVVCGDATVWEHEHVLEADAHVEPGGSAG